MRRIHILRQFSTARKYFRFIGFFMPSNTSKFAENNLLNLPSIFARFSIKSKVLLFLFFCCSLSVIAQEGFSTSEASIKIGRDLLSIKRYDSAAIYFQRAIELANQNKDEWHKTTAQSALGRAWVSLLEFDKAIEISNRVLNNDKASIRAKVISHQNIGLVNARSLKKLEKEFYHNHQALKIATENLTTHFNNAYSNDSTQLSNQARALQVLAYMHRNRRAYDSAHYYLDELINFAKNAKPFSTHNLVQHKVDLFPLYFYQNKLGEAKKEFTRTQPLIDKLPLEGQNQFNLASRYYNLLGVYHSRMGHNDSSLMAKKKQEHIMSISPRVDSTLLAQLQSNMGISYYVMANYDAAFEFEKKALALKKRILSPDNPSLAASYKWLGVYRIAQSYAGNEAVEYFIEALRINEKNYGKNHPQTVDAMHNLSHGLNAAGRFSESLKQSREALSIQYKINGSDYTTAAIYTAIADNLVALDSLTEGISAFETLIKISKNSKRDMSDMEVKAESGLGFIYIEFEDYDRALEHLKAAEKLSLNAYGANFYGLPAIYNGITKSLQKQERIDEALEANKKAIEVNSYDSKIFKIDPVPLNLLAKRQIQFVDSYILRTQLLLQKEVFQKSHDFDQFWKIFENSVEIIESWVSEQTNSSDIISLLSSNKVLYSAGIDALWFADSIHHKPQENIKMWQFSERSKAVNQKLNEKKRQTNYPLESTSQILEEQKVNYDKISNYKSLILNGNDHDSLGSGLFKALQTKKTLNLKLKSESPRDYSLTHIDKDISYEEVKAFLGGKQTIIDYFVSDKSLYAFVINNSAVHHFKFDWTEELQKQIHRFKEGLVGDYRNLHQKVSHDIYQAIFQPLESVIDGDNVIIIPDQTLWNINFDLLKTSLSDSLNTKSHYLLQKYAISYAYSTSLLLNKKKKRKAKGHLLAFAYAEDKSIVPQIDNMRDAAKENLPGTAMEVKRLTTSMNGKFYFGKQANEGRFKEAAGNYSILHLALHGEVNEEDPDNSKLFFTASDEKTNEDNVLHTFELYNMNLNAELAVLSACNTGSGQIVDGEGIMNIGKAFQYAGVRSVLLSQWPVSDAVAPTIMSSFYAHLKAGKNKAEALRLAKLEFLESANNISSNPYYWGSFFILGDPSSIDLNRNNNRWYWLIGLSIFASMLFLRKGIRQKAAV